jgi:Cys-tRNA(Pro)/Cys-tRNA(Cys) deacylase
MTKKNIAKTMPMRVLEERNIPYEPHQQSSKQYTAEGVAEDLGVPVAQVVKAMIVQRSDPQRGGGERSNPCVLVVIPGHRRLSLKKVGAVLGDKNARLAAERDVQRVTGYQVGAVSVLGFRQAGVPCYVDQQVLELEQVIISAGRPDVGLSLSPAHMVQAMDQAQIGDFCEEA